MNLYTRDVFYWQVWIISSQRRIPIRLYGLLWPFWWNKLTAARNVFQHVKSEISGEDNEYALKVWNAFECTTLRDFHTLYMKFDVALICDVFEHFCKIAHADYKLDPKHYITLPSFSFDAMLESSRVELEFSICPDAYLFLESAVRGGISVVSNRYVRSNNPLVPEYDVTIPTSYIGYYDADNLYAESMENEIPSRDFRFLDGREQDLNFWSQDSWSWWRQKVFHWMRHYVSRKFTWSS